MAISSIFPLSFQSLTEATPEFPAKFGAEVDLGSDSYTHALVLDEFSQLYEAPHPLNPLHIAIERYGVLVLRHFDFSRTDFFPQLPPKNVLPAHTSRTDQTPHFDIDIHDFDASPSFGGFFTFEGVRQSQTYFTPYLQGANAFQIQFHAWVDFLQVHRNELIQLAFLTDQDIDCLMNIDQLFIQNQHQDSLSWALILIRNAVGNCLIKLSENGSDGIGFKASIQTMIYSTLDGLKNDRTPVIYHRYQPHDLILFDEKQVLHGRIAAVPFDISSDPLGYFSILTPYSY
jgi:hypothetical protein